MGDLRSKRKTALVTGDVFRAEREARHQRRPRLFQRTGERWPRQQAVEIGGRIPMAVDRQYKVGVEQGGRCGAVGERE